MSNHSLIEYIEQSNDKSKIEAIGFRNTINFADQDSLEVSRKSSAHSSTCKSPKAKKFKMVHAPISAVNNKDNINEIYLEQLSVMKSRVSMLEISDGDHDKRFQSAPIDGKIIFVKPAENVENISTSAEEGRSVSEIDDQFDENIIYSNLEDAINSHRNNVTPRMFEVPPKKQCVRMKTPNFSPGVNRNLKLKSLWTRTNDKSTNTEGTWIRISLENIPNTIKSKSPVDPRAIIHKSASSTPETSIDDDRLQTASNITSIESPEFQISPCTPETEKTSSEHHRINSIIQIELDYSQDEHNSSDIELIKEKSETPVRSMSSNVKKLFKNNTIVPSTEESLQKHEGTSHTTEEIKRQPIHDGDYNIPLKHLGEKESYSIVKDVISNLALHFFKSKGTYEEIKLDTSVKEKVSFRSLAEEVPNELSENEKKIQAIRRILNENIENFRSKNVYATRRPQATDFSYYNIQSGVNLEIGAGEHVLRPDSVEDINAAHRDISDDEEEERQEPAGCCTLRACAEFMFPKRQPRFFE